VNITLTQLKCAMPRIGTFAVTYLPWLNSAMAEFRIDTKPRQSNFLAQLAHETGDLNRVVENLNYSADGLANTWPGRFAKKDAAGKYLVGDDGRKVPNAQALELHHQAEKIANVVYANRMGNGGPETGDGWRNRGAGGFQLTGADNQRECATYFRIPVDKIGDWLRTPEGVCRSAAWFWTKAGCNELADAGKVDAIADLVNLGHRTAAVGDAIGYADRLARTNNNMRVLA
jgi:putative chitinase